MNAPRTGFPIELSAARLARDLAIEVAAFRRIDPARQPIRDIAGIAVRRDPAFEAIVRNRTGIVQAGCAVEGPDVRVAGLVYHLGQAVAVGGAGAPLADHAGDVVVGAGRADAVLVARVLAVVVLHEARVADAVVGGRSAHAAAGLLHDDGENEAVVDEGILGDLLDGVVDGGDLVGAVVGDVELVAAGGGHLGFVVVEPGEIISLKRSSYREIKGLGR